MEVLGCRGQRLRRVRRGRVRGVGRRAHPDLARRRRVPARPHRRRARRSCSTSSSTRPGRTGADDAPAGRPRLRGGGGQLHRRRPGLPRGPRLGGRARLPGRVAARPPPPRPPARSTRSSRRPAGWPRRASRSTSSRPTSCASSSRSSPARPRRPAIVAPGGRLLGARRPPRQPRAGRLPRSPRSSAASRSRAGSRASARAPWPPVAGCSPQLDLTGYQVVERAPLEVRWRGHRLLTNPPPSFGGELVALGLLLLEERHGLAGGARIGRPRGRAGRGDGRHRRRSAPRGRWRTELAGAGPRAAPPT